MAPKKARAAPAVADKEVGVPCAAYVEMEKRWALIDDLRGGTYVMRKRGTKWLPKEEGESDNSYSARVVKSILYPGYDDAVRKLAAKPFSRPLTISEKDSLPNSLQGIEENANNARMGLGEFAKNLFEDGLDHGLTHVMVEFPQRDGYTTDADVIDGVHPYFVHVMAASVIGWQSKYDDEQGREVLTQVRIREQRVEASGKWGHECVNYVRVLTESSWQLWREGEKGEYSPVGGGDHNLGVVPLVTLYFKRTGFMTAEPPLEGLAYVNLAHWQGDSDQRNNLHVARVPFLSEVGIAKAKLNEKHVLSASKVHRTDVSAQDYRIGWVEVQGNALKIGAEDGEQLKSDMQRLGMEPMIAASSPRTAEEISAGREGTSTTLRDWVGRENDALYEAYLLAAKYVKVADLPEKFSVQIFDEWEVASGDSAGIETARAMYREGLMTKRETLRQIKRRGFYGDSVDLDQEIEDLDGEMPQATTTPEQQAKIDALLKAREKRAGKSAA